MTASATAPFISYAGAGLTGPYAIPFKFLANADIVAVKIDADGVEAILTGNTITGAGADAGGALTTAAPVAVGETLQIYRATARAQTAQYVANGPFPAATHERALDKAMLIDQEQDLALGRTLRLPIGETSQTLPSAADRANLFLGFDSEGRPAVGTPVAGGVGALVDLSNVDPATGYGHLSAMIVADLRESNTAAQNKVALVNAIQAALLTIKSPAGTMDWNWQAAGVVLPAGKFQVNGGIEFVEFLYLVAHSPGTTTLVVADDTFLFIQPALNALRNLAWQGINFVGGRGYLKLQNTGVAVQGYRQFIDCKFDNYTVCAVQNAGSDDPYWKFVRCQFMGAAAGGTIGVAIGGYIDDSCFIDCEFLRNKYHLKLGPRMSGSVRIEGCGFIQFTAGLRSADIWFVPNNTDANGVNAGQGTVIRACKFGNEGMLPGDCRFLFADEAIGSGSDRGSRSHSTTYNTTGFLAGIIFDQNRLSGVASPTSGFIKSYVANVASMVWGAANIVDGQYKWLLEDASPPSNPDAYVNSTWLVDLGPTYAMQVFFTSGVSNRPVGPFVDRQALQFDAQQQMTPGYGDDAGHMVVCDGNDGSFLTTDATKATVADLYGALRASEVTMTAAAAGVIVNLIAPVAGKMTWLQCDLRRGSSLPIDAVFIDIINTTTGKTAVRRGPYVLPASGWMTIAPIPFIMPESTVPSAWAARVVGVGYSAGAATKFQVSRLRITHGRQPVNGHHLRTVGSGRWDDSHIVVGYGASVYHQWVDFTAGKPRFKIGSAPTSEGDGTAMA